MEEALMERYATDRIRNVALVGHGGAGKTSLTEALLHRAGASPRLGRVEDGTTTSDFTPEERKRGLSLSLAVAPFTWHDHKVNLLDTPGYADFLGDVSAALRVADLAVFVVSAVDGVEAQTEVAWRMAAELRLPRLVFVNKLDRERADFEATLAQLQDRLGPGIPPLELPLGAEAGFRGIADLLTDTAHVYVDGVPHTEPIPEELEATERAVHDTLVEGIVVGDDGLLERYLDGEQLTLDELERALHDGIAAATVFPVVLGSATREVGIDRLADFLVEIGPSPLDRVTTVRAGDTEVDVAADASGQPLAFVFKTVLDPYVGQISLFRTLSGTIRADDHLVNSRTGNDERLHGLLTVRGREQQPVGEVVAGDIAAVAKLAGATTGDTLAPRGTPVSVPPIEQPEPVLAVAVAAATQGDEDKPQTLLRGTGEPPLKVTLEKLTRRFGCKVATDDVRVPYRETITGSARRVEGRHKKQTGGHGQFAVAVVNVEPLPRGEGFEFVDKIVGGAISRGYVPAVQKGIEEAMASGGAFGYPVVDVRVTLTDGKEHPVDSSEMAFKVAGRLAFRAALAQANPVVLEPVSRLEITVPLALQGEVLGDLNSRRGRVLGTEVGEVPGEQVLVASVPTAEVQRYAVALRSLTGGRGRFRHRHDHYAPLPAHLVDAVRREVSEGG